MANFQTLPKSPPQLLWWRCVGLQEIYGLHLPFTLRQTPGLRSKGPNHTPPSAYTIYQNVPSAELFSFFCSNNKNFPLFFIIIIILKSSPQRFSLPVSVWFVATVDQYLVYELPMRKQNSPPNCSEGLDSSVCFLVCLFLIHGGWGLQRLEGCLWP